MTIRIFNRLFSRFRASGVLCSRPSTLSILLKMSRDETN